jgi:Tol biopolymer transport system component
MKEVLEGLSTVTSQRQSISPAKTLRHRTRKLALAISFMILAGSAAGFYLWNAWSTLGRTTPVEVVPLTSSLGIETTPSLSPDGNSVAFSWNGWKQNNFDIYVQLIGVTEPPQRLTTDPAEDAFPTWSPNGSEIAFLRRHSATEHSVFVIPFLGGPERLVTRTIRAGLAGVGNAYGGLSWSSDQRLLAMVDRGSPEEPDSIFLFSLETGEKKRLSFPGESGMDDTPKFSPDGNTLAYHRSAREQEHIVLLNMISGEERYLFSTPLFIRGLDWTPDGSAIVFSISEMFLQEPYLMRVAVAGGEPKRQAFGGGAGAVSIARSGGRMVYERWQQKSDIWLTNGPTSTRGALPTRFAASSTLAEHLPEYSPDGSKIVFASNRLGDLEVWRCDVDGTKLQKLTDLGFALPGEWSPEGDRIAFAGSESGDEIWDIFVVDEYGGLPRNVTQDEFSDASPSWSLDGSWIYYHSFRDDDGVQIFKVPAEGGSPVQLTKNEGLVPRVTDDDQLLYFRDGCIWTLPQDGGEETLVLDKGLGWIFDWYPWRSNIIYYGRDEKGGLTIEMFNRVNGAVHLLHSLPEGAGTGFGLAVSPDGQWILYTQSEASADLMLVEGFN